MKKYALLLVLLASTLLTAPAAALQADALVAHWRFDESSGMFFGDSSGLGFDASIGPGITLNQPGGFPSTGAAAFFDANAQGNAKVPNLPPLSSMVADLTVVAWVRNEPGAPSGLRRVFGTTSAGWSCGITGGGLRFTTKGILDYDLPFTLADSVWYHLAFVFDENFDVTYYVDGVQVGFRTGSSPSNTPTGAYVIGSWNQTVEYWHGYMDDLQVYKDALTSAQIAFLFQNPGASVSQTPGLSHCFGDSSATNCPCGNLGSSGDGCVNSTGRGAKLLLTGSASFGMDDLLAQGTQLVPGSLSVLFAGHQSLNAGSGMVFGDGLRCAGGQVRRLGVRMADSNGNAGWGPGLTSTAQWAPGDSRSLQVWYQDLGGSPCGAGFNTSQAMQLTILP
jgi:hypothetical protein